MGFIKENPILWGIVFAVLLVAIIVAISSIVSKRRKKEVEEIEKMFPEGNMRSEDVKISVERVRRSTQEREKRKQTRPRIHRERPREVHPDEDKEFIRREKDEVVKQDRDSSVIKENPSKEGTISAKKEIRTTTKATRESDSGTAPKKEMEQPSKSKGMFRKPGTALKSDLLSTPINKYRIEDYKKSRGNSLLQQTMDKEKKEKEQDLAGKQKTHKVSEQMNKSLQAKGDQGTVDKATSRRLFKRSLLKPDNEARTDSDKLPKASLIDARIYSGHDKREQDQIKTPSRQERINNKGFFSKRK